MVGGLHWLVSVVLPPPLAGPVQGIITQRTFCYGVRTPASPGLCLNPNPNLSGGRRTCDDFAPLIGCLPPKCRACDDAISGDICLRIEGCPHSRGFDPVELKPVHFED